MCIRDRPGDTAVAKQELFIGNVKTGMFKKVDVVKWRGQLLEVMKVADVHDRVFFIRKKGCLLYTSRCV